MAVQGEKTEKDFLKSLTKTAIAAGFFLCVLVIIHIGARPYAVKIKEGDISLVTIYAPFGFSYPSRIDETKTGAARESALQEVPPVYNVVTDAPSRARSLAEAAYPETKGLPEGYSLDAYKDTLNKVLGLVYRSYVVESDTKDALIREKKEAVVVRDSKSSWDRAVRVEDLLTAGEIRKKIITRFDDAFPKDADSKRVLIEAVMSSIQPNIALNKDATKEAEDAAARGITPVYEFQEIKKNEIVIERGQRIRQNHIAMLKELRRAEAKRTAVSYLTGIVLLLLIFVTIFYNYIRFTEPEIIRYPKYLSLIALLALLLIGVGKATALTGLPNWMLPLASITMLLGILISSNTAVVVGVLLSVMAGIIFGGKLDLALVLFVSGMVGIYMVKNLRSRFQIIIAGLASGLGASLVIVALGMLSGVKPAVYLGSSLWGIANGVLSSFLVMGLLPVFEYLFKISTNITLLELSDMSHPLLKELALKAPGTYLHSHLVGNLAEAACEAIGANALLARIGSYYHDIGKIDKAEYFSENEMSLKSKHSGLKPSMSSLVIGNHVKEGLELAGRHNLNRQITDIIQQHHGTSLMYFFYKRALEDVAENGPLKEQDYRYPGPKPQTKEAAVVLLADSVEASSRTLDEPTPGKIRNMVHRIINNKFIDNQLDECGLTLTDLSKIAEAFVRVLVAAFHVRTEYPGKDA